MNIRKTSFVLGGLTFAAALMALAAPALALAATTLYFSAPTSSIPVGSSFSVKVLVDTDQPLNAYAIQVGLAGNGDVQFLYANNANSIITVWQNTPALSASGGISWNGGSLTPFDGTGGELMTLNFTAVATGTATFSFNNSYVYLANGKGTKIVPQTEGASVAISPALEGSAASGNGGANLPTGTTPEMANLGDTTPPAISYLSLVADPFNAAQKLLAFSVSDTGSGVKEADLRYRSGFFWSGWQVIQNPAPLANAVWEADFRAVDNAGNIAERTLYDWTAFTRFLLAAIIVIVFVIGLVLLFWRRRKMIE
jgi:hypothetical protein